MATRRGSTGLIIGLVILFIAQSLGGLVQSYLLGVVGERIVARLRERAVRPPGDTVAGLPRAQPGGRAGVAAVVGRDAHPHDADPDDDVVPVARSSASWARSIILFTLSPTLLLIALLLAPALIAVAIVFGRPLQRSATQVQDAIANSTATAEEALGGIRVVKSYVREDYEIGRYRRRPLRGGRRGLAARAVASGLRGPDGVPRLRGHRRPALVHRAPGHRRHARHRDAHGLPPVRHHDRCQPRDASRACTGSSARAPGPSPACSRSSTPQPTVVDVRARYRWAGDGPQSAGRRDLRVRRRRDVLRDVTLDMRAGRGARARSDRRERQDDAGGAHPAVVGRDAGAPSASTASTSARSPRRASAAQIGLVPRRRPCSAARSGENIRYGRLGATDAEVEAAARAANAHDFITALAAGLRHARGGPRACACRAASASGSRSPGRSSRTRRSSCSTRRRARSTTSPSAWCRRRSSI